MKLSLRSTAVPFAAALLVLAVGCSSSPTSTDAAAPVVPTVLPVTAGANAVANGKALQDTLKQANTAKADKTFVVLLPAGTYDLGKDTVAIYPYVTIMGSGEGTIITGSGSPLVVVSHNSALGFVTVQNLNSTAPMAQAVSVSGGRMFRVHVKIGASGSGTSFLYAVKASSDADLTDVTAEAVAGNGVGGNSGQVAGIFVGTSDDDAGVHMRNVSATATGGDYLSTGIGFDQKATATLNDVTAVAPATPTVNGQQPFAIYCLIGCKIAMNDSEARGNFAIYEGDTATHTNAFTGARDTLLGSISFKNLNCAGGSKADGQTTHCF